MSSNTKILVVDDDEDILTASKLLLKQHYGSVTTCADPGQIEGLMAETGFDVILLDMNFGPGESSGRQGLYWLKNILAIDPEAVVIPITAHGGVEVAVDAIKVGAMDFIEKPWQNEKLLATLAAGVTLRRTRIDSLRLQSAVADVGPGQAILGRSPAIRHVLEVVARAAPTDANVLLLGENGTGKGLAAAELYRRSARAGKIFASIDLGAVPESLFESELFGHRRGAFTGADDDRMGRLEAASGGTLFLDEVSNLPLHLQAKLLAALDERRIYPVGSNKAVDIDVRLIAATNLPRAQLEDDGRFRQDLLYRLNTVEITMPPLRERSEDIATIARHYADVYGRKYGKPEIDFAGETISAITNHDWPGNVRALRHAVERAVILAAGTVLEPADFNLTAPAAAAGPMVAGNLNLEELERNAVRQALQMHGYNISHAAKALGLTRAALYRRMDKYGL